MKQSQLELNLWDRQKLIPNLSSEHLNWRNPSKKKQKNKKQKNLNWKK